MAKHSRQLNTKTARINQPRTGAIKRKAKKSQKQLQRRSWVLSTLAIAMLFSSAGVIIGFGWISILFIFDPQQVTWLNKFLPSKAQITVSKKQIPQTLAEIKLGLSKQKRIPGESISLTSANNNNNQTPNLFLLPIFQKRKNCQSDCQAVTEIRVYERTKEIEFQFQPQTHYDLITQVSITGVTKSFVESPVDNNVVKSENQQPKNYLPLTEIQSFNDSTSPGFWFYLHGQHKPGDKMISYGKIIHYNPQLRSLQHQLSWKNPNGKLPQWQQVTGDATKELVINQTLGLEPQLQVYQLKSGKLINNSVILEAINLKPLVKSFGYQKSLLLARNGLWTPAYAWLQSLQKQSRKPFSASVQAQIDLIGQHSQLTKIQADKNWASPSQQVLTALIDGRWEKALEILRRSPYSGEEISNLLQADRGRLWNRTTVALRLNPNRRAVLAWAYLMLSVHRGEKRANTWLQGQQKIDEDTLPYLQSLSAQLNQEITNTHQSQIIGGVQKVTRVNYQDWLPVDGKVDLQIQDQQKWYQVEVSGFHDGKNWLNYPFSNYQLPKIQTSLFWTKILGITADPTIQIVVWLPNGEQQIKTATIKAVQMRQGILKLLAAGDFTVDNQDNSLQPQPLALTAAALEWIQPSPISIQTLEEENPQIVERIITTVWRSLQESGDISADQAFIWEEIKAKMGDWPVQKIDITNDGNLELVLTISGSAITTLTQPGNESLRNRDNQQRPRTLILSATGQVIYTDFAIQPQQRLSAIAKLTYDQSLALLVENGDRYSLRRWSAVNQRLE